MGRQFLMVLSFLHALKALSEHCPPHCMCSAFGYRKPKSWTVVCIDGVPEYIPRGTVAVSLSNIRQTYLSNDTFHGTAWANVRDLSIYDGNSDDSVHVQSIHDFTFCKFISLVRLKLTMLSSVSFDKKAFSFLPALNILDLSGTDTNADNVIRSFADPSILPQLEELDLSYPNTLENIYTSEQYLDSFKSRPLKSLNLSGTVLRDLPLKSLPEVFPELRVLNISFCNLAIILANRSILKYLRLPKTLQILDISEAKTIPISSLPTHKVLPLMLNGTFKGVETFENITHLYARHVFPIRFELHGHVGIKKQCYKFKVINVENNGLIKLNITLPRGIYFPKLEQIFLGGNGLKYVNPNIFHTYPNLQFLNLSKNTLHAMSPYKEFNNLLTHSTRLEEIHLSDNLFETIPYDFFAANEQLKVLDLSYNLLTQISFKIKHLQKLLILDLRHNQIKSLDQNLIVGLNLHNNKRHSTNETSFKFGLSGNPLACTCEEREIIGLLISRETRIWDKDYVMCTLESESLRINKKVLGKVDFLCKKSIIIAVCASLAATVSFFLVVAPIACFIMRRRKNKKAKIKRLIRKYRTDDLDDYRFLVFLCYCAEDEEFATHRVYMELEKLLQEKLHTQRELICIGDRHFIPGKPIIANIVKHVECSDVIILLVSREFCRSRWCDLETTVSYYDQKPMILMFKENVPNKELPRVLGKIHKTYARVFWKEQADGDMELVPSWNKLTDIILGHAGALVQERKKNYGVYTAV